MKIAGDERLPEGFSALEPFVERWAGEDTTARISAREVSTMDEIRDFYSVMLQHADNATALINKYPLDDLPRDVSLLCKLMLGFCHATIAVEVLNNPRVKSAPYPTGVRVMRGSPPFG